MSWDKRLSKTQFLFLRDDHDTRGISSKEGESCDTVDVQCDGCPGEGGGASVGQATPELVPRGCTEIDFNNYIDAP